MPFITGIGWVTAAGMGCGRDRPAFHMAPGALPPVARRAITEKPFPHFGRMDPFSKLGLAGIAFALKDAGLDEWTVKRPFGIIASTVYGCLKTDADYFDTVTEGHGLSPSPILFSYTLSNCFLGEAAGHFGITGLSYVISDPHFATLAGLKAALLNLRLNTFQKCLAGIVDGECPQGFPSIAQALPGAVFVVIEPTPSPGRRPYGRVELSQDGKVLLDGREPGSLIDLVRDCLAALEGESPEDR